MDGTDLPAQCDIIADLHTFFDALAVIIPLAREIGSISDEIKSEYTSVDVDIQKLKHFRVELETAITEIASRYDPGLVENYVERMNDVSSICFTRQTHQTHSAFHSSKQRERRSLGALRERISKDIVPVFKSCMLNAQRRYMASMVKGRIRGKVISTLDNVSCTFALKIKDEILTIRHLIDSDVHIPVLGKSSSKLTRLISDSGKYINIADYIMTSFDCHDTVSMTFANKRSWLNLHINPHNSTYSITYNSEDGAFLINESSEFPSELNKKKTDELLFLIASSLASYLEGIEMSKYLSACTYNGEDAIETNHILEMMQVIAEHYVPTASECLRRGRISTELSIRVDDGMQSQVKTLSLNHIADTLNNTGDVGAKLAAMFGANVSDRELKKSRVNDILGRIEAVSGSKSTEGLIRFEKLTGIPLVSDVTVIDEKSHIKRTTRVQEILHMYDEMRPSSKND